MPTISAQPSIELPTEKSDFKEHPADENFSQVVNGVTTGQLTVAVTPSSAFQIINQDNLGQIVKPNAIVRPVRRAEPVSGQKSVIDDLNKKSQELEKFTKELDLRLRRLKREKKGKSPVKNVRNLQNQKSIGCNNHYDPKSLHLQAGSQETLNKRPLFITTVPTGIFLQPIKEAPVSTKRVYAFASRPRVFTNRNPTKDSKASLERVGREISAAINGIRAFTSNFISANAPKHREPQPQGSEPYKNIMFERRVVRGSNYSHNHLMAGDSDIAVKEAEARRRQILRKRCLTRNQRHVLGTPPPIPGRVHEDVQTEKYLEELFERPPEADANVQTDLFLQRPPSPPYVPEKVGIDVSTEILDGDLFDFDTEVQPILETLVGHSVQQSIVEVLHEEEVADLKKQQQEFLAIREADLAELRRLEAEELRLQAEKERRLREDKISKDLDSQMQEQVTAAKLLQGHIATLLPEVLGSLEPLSDATNKEKLEQALCPWLTKEVSEEVGRIIDSREILTEIIKEIVKQRAAIYAGYEEEEEEEEEPVEEEGQLPSAEVEGEEEH